MSVPNTFSPGTKAKSAEVNDNFTALADGSAALDNNSLAIMRAENIPAYAVSGVFWSQATGLNGAMSAGVVYVTASGKSYRLSMSVIASRAFTASKDTYIYLDNTGAITYTALANGASYPSVPSGSVQLAVVVTDATTITQIYNTIPRSTYDGGMELGRCTCYAATDTLTVANMPVRKYLKIIANMLPVSNIDVWARFNADAGNNYSNRYMSNFSAATALNNSGVALNTSNGAFKKVSVIELDNVSAQEKLGSSVTNEAATAGAGTAPTRFDNSFKWAVTSQAITRVDMVNLSSGDFAAGSELIVYGHN